MKESDLTPRAFVGQPLPVAGVSDGRRHALPYNSDQASRTDRTCAQRLGVAAAVSSGRFQQPSAAGDGGGYNRH